MTTTYDHSADKPRHDAFCYLDEIEEGTGADAGTYTFKDSSDGSKLGDHSAVIVTDSPGLLLFYNKTTGKLIPW